MAKRLVRWFCFTVSFTFVPLISIFVISNFTGTTGNDYKYMGELLFSSVIISADSLRILIQTKKTNMEILRDILYAFCFFTIFYPALLYGILMSDLAKSYTNMHTMPIMFLISTIACGLAVNIIEGDD